MAEEIHGPRVVLVTGGAGFIGANHVHHLLATDGATKVVVLDALTYAGNPQNLSPVAGDDRFVFVEGDIRDERTVHRCFADFDVDTVIHFAAESHVDRSIDAPGDFLTTNVDGTFVLLQAARERWQGRDDVRFHHVSTDEVYGSLGDEGLFTEETAYDPSSPYSASKAASDHLVRAWHRTFAVPVTISNCSNNYGPYQFPEKLIPLMIAKALAGEPLPIYGDGSNVRDWLYVADHCRALDAIVRRGAPGRTYNVGGHNEWTNLALVELLCDVLEEERPSGRDGGYRAQVDFVKDRPGHDRRYAIDASRIDRELDWRPAETFETGLRKTVRWYLERQDWVAAIRDGSYAGERLGLG